ncbi:MAG: hypothetical protein HUJ69_06985, partial [Lachnospiraceae bacterium]|nr:hypothetical protein [Lachnospiraceae bacterium]
MKRLIEKHGKRTLAFLLTALMVISLLPVVVLAEEGKTDKFVPDTAAPWHTRASVTMDDGTIITVEGTDNGAVLGPDVTLSVKDIAASGTFAVNHGELDSGYLAYEISILDKDGKLLNDSAGNYWLTIENRFIKDDWNLMSSSSGALENVKQASASNGSICIPNNQWNGLIPTNGSAITVMAGKMEPLSDTFLSKVGPYSIDFILRNYNAFVSGDYDGSHVSGPVVVGGSACNTQLGGINNTDPEKLIVSVETIKSYKHTIPSYIGTMNEGATRQILTNNINVPLYLGPEEVGNKWAVQYDQWNAKDNDNYWYTSEFVDWDIAMAN